MSLQQLEQPPPYAHDRLSLDLPSVPSSNVTPLPHLPPMEPKPSLNYSNPMDYPRHDHSYHNQTPHSTLTLQPLRLPQVPSHAPNHSATTPHHNHLNHQHQDASSIQNPEERMAVEALLGIGKAPVSSQNVRTPRMENKLPPISSPSQPPSAYQTPLKYYPIDVSQQEAVNTAQHAQEPLLTLLTNTHPWLASTISGSVSAYSASKSITPRFIQSGADLVESTLGAVGRRTGVEGGIRRYLDARRPEEADRSPLSGVKVADDHMNEDINGYAISRKVSGTSVDSLPAYDNNRSPEYEDTISASSRPDQQMLTSSRPAFNRSWSTQLMISTSGLGAALNEASLHSLKFCLSLLRDANSRVRWLMDALKSLLSDHAREKEASSMEKGGDDTIMTDADNEMRLHSGFADRIKRISDDIWVTFKQVVNSVSRYTGGALPENASAIVRWQLLSVPSRWQRAVSTSQQNDDDAVTSANRMLAFAMEGLDMMDQVGGVVDSTISSAERWLDRMGRKRDEPVSEDKANVLPSLEKSL